MSTATKYPERCSCGVPMTLHATACGWQNAKRRFLPGEKTWTQETDAQLMRRAAATGDLDPQFAPPECLIPPDGWKCTREGGHDGPCATVMSRSDRVTLKIAGNVTSALNLFKCTQIERDLIESLSELSSRFYNVKESIEGGYQVEGGNRVPINMWDFLEFELLPDLNRFTNKRSYKALEAVYGPLGLSDLNQAVNDLLTKKPQL